LAFLRRFIGVKLDIESMPGISELLRAEPPPPVPN
jgi:hypothetical protein